MRVPVEMHPWYGTKVPWQRQDAAELVTSRPKRNKLKIQSNVAGLLSIVLPENAQWPEKFVCVFCCYLRNIEIMTKVWGLEELLLISVSAVLRTDSGCSSQLSDTVGNAAHLPCRQNGIRAWSGNRCCRACCQTISHLMLIRSTGVALAVFELPCNCL